MQRECRDMQLTSKQGLRFAYHALIRQNAIIDPSSGFGIIVWEMATGKKPFADYNQHMLMAFVVKEGKRPPLSYRWPKEFQDLLKMCWHKNPNQRPVRVYHHAGSIDVVVWIWWLCCGSHYYVLG